MRNLRLIKLWFTASDDKQEPWFYWVLSKPKHLPCSLTCLEAQGQQHEQCQEGWAEIISDWSWQMTFPAAGRVRENHKHCCKSVPASLFLLPTPVPHRAFHCSCRGFYLRIRSKAIVYCPWYLSIPSNSLPTGSHLGSPLCTNWGIEGNSLFQWQHAHSYIKSTGVRFTMELLFQSHFFIVSISLTEGGWLCILVFNMQSIVIRFSSW